MKYIIDILLLAGEGALLYLIIRFLMNTGGVI